MDPDRRAFERDIITRAMQHDCVLYRNANGETVAFAWRSGDEQVGPEFAVRDLAVDWMAQRLNGRGRRGRTVTRARGRYGRGDHGAEVAERKSSHTESDVRFIAP